MEYLTLRYFPHDKFGARNCYTIRSLTTGMKYLIRATFNYGNYDKFNKPPIFDIYLGVNFWHTVNTTTFSYAEIITFSNTDNLQVCLGYNYSGDPFISSIHVRKLNTNMYKPEVNSGQSLISVWRYNLGASNHPLVRSSICFFFTSSVAFIFKNIRYFTTS
jgi:Malectin-like domain